MVLRAMQSRSPAEPLSPGQAGSARAALQLWAVLRLEMPLEPDL
jgi:hypothetical protein